MNTLQPGGRINADSVDNVGGVDCSDNEVNIKILLNGLVQSGDLTVKQRNQLLYDMTDEVSEIVLKDCVTTKRTRYQSRQCVARRN